MPANIKKAAVSGYVSTDSGDFTLLDADITPAVFCDSADWPGVHRAVNDLCADISRVTGGHVRSADTSDAATVLVGTLGKCGAIDDLVSAGRLDASGITGKWESFLIQVVENTLVIAGSDQRGTIFGIYDLCQKIGVSPWHWWADVVPGYADGLYIRLEQPYVEPEPQVKYRGIFINDEYAFDNWAMARGDTQLVDTYERVFELLLRLKANTIWPAMHFGSPPFHQDLRNPANAARYGIVVGTSHCEQMLRCNEQEYLPFEEAWEQRYPDRALFKKKLPDSPRPCAYAWTETDPDTGVRVWNKKLLIDYWREGVEQFGQYEGIFTMGMRGLHDAGWQPVCAETAGEKAAQMEEIIAVQRAILSEVLGKPAGDIPQLLIPYKEIQEIYDSGMQVPEDITLMWSDDNFGYLRWTPSPDERGRSGDAGVYYHVGYHGDPNSYIWQSNVPLALIREEMGKAYDCGADRIWVLNVGDLKPAETEMEYFLDLARRTDEVRDIAVRDWLAGKAQRDFSFDEAAAREYADIMTRFHRLVFARKPEHFRPDLFALEAYGDEGQRYLDKYRGLVSRAEALERKLPPDDLPAFFELLLYPLRTCERTVAKFICADRSRLYAAQGRGGCANQYAMESNHAYLSVVNDTVRYNTLLGGKWSLIMDPYQPSFQKRGAVLPNYLPVGMVSDTGYAGLIVLPEGSMRFARQLQNRRFIDLCNTGSGYVDWYLEGVPEWLECSADAGTVVTDCRLWLRADWGNVPVGHTDAAVTIVWRGSDKVWARREVAVQIDNEPCPLPPEIWMEADGVISIAAAQANDLVQGKAGQWIVEPDLGREYDSLKACFTAEVEIGIEDAPAAVYRLWFTSIGRFPLEVYRLPTLNETG